MVVAKTTRRFGAHDVANGPFKDAVHVGTKRYQIFSGQLNYLHNYLSQRLLPTEPEDVTMQGILIILQNLLEHECEVLIRHYVTKAGTIKETRPREALVQIRIPIQRIDRDPLLASHARVRTLPLTLGL
jgi:hypothetical protein